MALISKREVEIEIDDERTITLTPTTTDTIVLAVEDPHTVAIVEMPMEKVAELIEKLMGLSDG